MRTTATAERRSDADADAGQFWTDFIAETAPEFAKPTIEQIKERWANYETEAQRLELPSAPKPFLQYFEDPSRPQTRLDRDFQNGFGVSIGRLREDKLFDYRFVCLSHNTVRGAAGGGILTAELLCRKGYIPHRV